VCIVSSFGAESAVLLHMAAGINPHVPVILVDTLLLFPETLHYQTELSTWLGLTDVRRISILDQERRARDPYGALHIADPDACCTLRKVEPLERALFGMTAHISGRKRFQAGTRAQMQLFEADAAGRIKVNPLATWTPTDIAAYMDTHALPRHPMVAKGFPSIGCVPCTSPAGADEDPRAGRWRGQAKTECGIHFDTYRSAERRAS